MAAIVASKTATGATSGTNVEGCDFAVSGTFVGTWAFQALINDTWETMQTGTAPAAYVGVRFSQATPVRFNVTAYTSGTVVFNLAGAND